MQRLDHKRLWLRERGVVKVWEIELCAVAGGHVVNVRQGLDGGGALRESTLTPAPVSEARARQLWERAIADRVRDGYRDEPAPAAPDEQDAAAARIVARLRQGPHGKGPLSRAVWSAGRRRIREAEPALLEILAASREPVLTYAAVWALARAGSPRALPGLEAIRRDDKAPAHLRDVAAEAIRALTPATGQPRLVAAERSALPEGLRTALRDGVDAIVGEIERIADGDRTGQRTSDALAHLYRLDDEVARPALLRVLARASLTGPHRRAVRRIFKAAELRGDGEVFGLVDHVFETTGLASDRTRVYLRRRAARTLRKLGAAGSPEYAVLATGVLLAFDDDDARPPRQRVEGYGPRAYTLHWDRLAPFLAINQVLYGASPRYRPDRHGKAWRLARGLEPGAPATGREEGFAPLWDAAPDALIALVRRSRLREVHEMAAGALRAQLAVVDALGDDVLVELLASRYPVTQELAVAAAQRRPLSPALLRALAECPLIAAHGLVHGWLDQHRDPPHDTALLALLVASRHGDNRRWIAGHLRGLVLSAEAARVLVGRVLAEIGHLGDSADDDERARDAGATLVRVFPRELATLGVDVIRDLLRHPLAAAQELAADLIAGHATLRAAVPDDLLLAMLDSPHPAVRTVGARLLGEMPDAELARHPELFVALSIHPGADLRAAVRATIARVAASDAGRAAGFGLAIAAELRERLLTPLPEGAPAHVVSLLRAELRDHLGEVDRAHALRLLGARSPHAQELGGLLLERVAPDELELADIVKLASHDLRAVREASWALARGAVARFRVAMPALAKLLDARWDDSRQAAFALLEDAFGPADYTPEMLVTICDSVRPDVQRFGRDLVTRHARAEDAPTYLLRLSEHPDTAVQLFVTNYLEEAAGDVERIARLAPYFIAVLSRVNAGRVAKQRCLRFLIDRASRDHAAAQAIAPILARVSATSTIETRAAALRGMVAIRARFPDIELPLRAVAPERRAV